MFINIADTGFFAQRRNDPKVNATVIIVECKNYSKDMATEELDVSDLDVDDSNYPVMVAARVVKRADS